MMTDRAEIERLLNMTGRTLEGLQTEDQMFDDPKYHEKIDEYFKARSAVSYDWPHTFGLYQSQMIELLVGALRDALDKPMQKPLTLHQLSIHQGKLWVEFKEFSSANGWQDGLLETLFWTDKVFEGFKRCEYLAHWRCWENEPTDKEREAAAWES